MYTRSHTFFYTKTMIISYMLNGIIMAKRANKTDVSHLDGPEKTTLIHIITGLLNPKKGKVILIGNVGNDPEIDARGAFTTIPVATIPFEIDFVGAEDQLVPSIKHFDF